MLQEIAAEVPVKEVVRLSAFTSFPGVIAALSASSHLPILLNLIYYLLLSNLLSTFLSAGHFRWFSCRVRQTNRNKSCQ